MLTIQVKRWCSFCSEPWLASVIVNGVYSFDATGQNPKEAIVNLGGSRKWPKRILEAMTKLASQIGEDQGRAKATKTSISNLYEIYLSSDD